MRAKADYSIFSSANCVVTGGCGFIGSNLVRALIDAGAHVTVIDNLSTGKLENLPSPSSLRLIEADVAVFTEWGKVLSEAHYVFHLAAQVGNIKSIQYTLEDALTNVIGSVRLYAACRQAAIRKLVYASSSAIFGEADDIPISEDHPQRPASFYGLTKQTAEQYALLAHELWSVPAVCTRFFNVYGTPMESSEYSGVINIFLDRCKSGLPLTIYGDGLQIRDFVFVEDVCQAILLAAARGVPGQTYNIGSGVSHTVCELANVLLRITGSSSKIENAPARAGEVRRSAANIAKARRQLGYDPEFPLERGLGVLWSSLSAA